MVSDLVQVFTPVLVYNWPLSLSVPAVCGCFVCWEPKDMPCPSHKLAVISHLKPLHTICKVPLNASILYKNQEICNKTNLWKFQLISLFLLRENSKNAFSIFVFILMAGVFVSRDENSLLDLSSLIIRKRQHIRQKYFKESFLPSLSLYHVSLWTFLFFGLTNVVQGFKRRS